MANNQLTTLLESFISDSGTNDVSAAVKLFHRSTGTPASGLGVKIVLGAEDSAGNDDECVELHGYLTTVTSGAEVSAFKLRLKNSGTLQDALAVSVGSNSATVGSNQTTANLWNTTATTVNAFGAATAINIGAASGTLTLLNRIIKLTGQPSSTGIAGATLSVNTTSSGGAGRLLAALGVTDVFKWKCTVEGDVTNEGDLAVNGGDLTSTATTFNLLNSTVTTLNIGGAATTIALGSQDVDVSLTMGRARLYSSSADAMTLAHYDINNDVSYAIKQNSSGDTILNAASGRSVFLRLNNTSYLTLTASTLTFADATNIVTNGTTGTKIGTATSQKIGFWNVTPIIQPASANQAALSLDVDVTGGDTVDKAAINTNFTNIQTLVNQLRSDLVAAGLIKGAA